MNSNDDINKEITNSFIKKLDRYLIIFFISLIFCAAIGIFYLMSRFSDSGITISEFNKIEIGMTYDEVVSIIGEEGECFSSLDLGLGSDYKTELFTWNGPDGISTASVMFQDNKVISKSQFGLN